MARDTANAGSALFAMSGFRHDPASVLFRVPWRGPRRLDVLQVPGNPLRPLLTGRRRLVSALQFDSPC